MARLPARLVVVAAWLDRSARGALADILTLPLIVLGLLVTLALDPEELVDRAAPAAIGYLALRTIDWVYERLRGREGLGQGDAKLFAAAGAWLGTAALPQVILLAAAMALLVAVALDLAGSRLHAHTALPFGAFVALATWPIWLLGLPSW